MSADSHTEVIAAWLASTLTAAGRSFSGQTITLVPRIRMYAAIAMTM
jgi:hypothetical protein